MAEDKLIFPIGFDLEKGVKEAGKNWDQYAKKLESELAKRAIKVKLSIDTSNLDNLDAVKQRLAQLKIEPITPQTKSAIKELAAELRTLAKALEQVQKYSTIQTPELQKALANKANAEAAFMAEKYRQANERVEISKRRVTLAEQKHAEAMNRNAKASRTLSKEYQTQDGYLSRLIKRLAVYAGFSAIRSFLTGVREVTAEFELQRVSLGAIIQDQNRANQLFSEIKNFALKSPIKILDLTTYVKQVAAYRIETDKLFDTTKRLADVSVGLGVDMGRLVLAYGQVKAASYLRAAEIRQFTEAGIPMLELLSEKFTEIQGKAVSTEQVMDLVSKRAVSFSMVEEIFKDMTDAGGMFYNMQEKQAQTLFGMWSKLGDAAAVMYEEIGNTSWVNAGMKEGIGLLESMMRGWRGVASGIGAAGFAFLAFKSGQAILRMMQVNTIAAAAATRQYARAQEQLNIAKKSDSTLSAKIAGLRARAAAANRMAATSTNLWTVANYKLQASFLSLRAASGDWIGLAITAVIGLVTWLVRAKTEANKLNNELAKISAEGASKADEMARNFERLAKTVVESADGSKQQNDALAELKRTYSDVIPAQDLTIAKLREMKGEYEAVTQAIKQKIYQQNLEQQLSTIQENYGGKISKGEKKTKELLEGYGLSPDEVGRVMAAIRSAINDGLLTTEDDIKTRMSTIQKIIEQQTGKTIQTTEAIYKTVAGTGRQIFVGTRVTNAFNNLSKAITKIVKPTTEMNDKVKEQTEYMTGLTRETGRYTDIVQNTIKEAGEFSSALPASSDAFKLDKQKHVIDQYAKGVRNLFEDAAKNFPAAAKINIDNFFVDGEINWDAATEAAKNGSQQFQNALSALKTAYDESLPQMDGWKKELQSFSKVVDGLNNGNPIRLFDDNTINQFKSLDDALQKTAQQYKDNKALAEQYTLTLQSKTISDETRAQTEKLKAEAETMAALSYAALVRFNALKLLQTSGSGGSDTRLQTLNEIEQTLTSINKKYEELVKKEGQTAALDYVKKNYESTLKYVNELGKKFGLKFEIPTDFKDLQTYRQSILNVIKQLRMKGFEKAAIALELKIAEGSQEKLEQQIDKQLKELADKISRTKTAKEFYQKILDQTGDIELATKVSISIYGDTGKDLEKQIKQQLTQAFSNIGESMKLEFQTGNVDLLARPLIDAAELVKKGWEDVGEGIATVFSSQYGVKQDGKEVEILVTPILPDGTVLSPNELEDYVTNTLSGATDILKADEKGIVISVGVSADGQAGEKLHELQEAFYGIQEAIKRGNYKELDQYVKLLPAAAQETTKKLIDAQKKELANIAEQGAKLLLSYDEIAQKRVNIEQEASNKIKKLRDAEALYLASNATAEQKTAYSNRTNKAIKSIGAKRDLDLLKLQDEYLRFFSAIHSLTKKEADELRGEVRQALFKAFQDGAISADELKRELKAIDEQFNKLIKDQGKFVSYLDNGFEGLINRLRDMSDEMMSVGSEISKMDSVDQISEGQKSFIDTILKQFGNDATGNSFASLLSNTNGDLSQMGSLLQGISGQMGAMAEGGAGALSIVDAIIKNVAATIEGIAAIRDQLNEMRSDDNQLEGGFWDAFEYLENFNKYAAQGWEDLKSGNVVGAVQNTIQSIISIFGTAQAQRVRRANKEIEKQQEILDQLEYSYSRLEKAAEKAFGGDYIKNFKDQQANLQAQITATERQLAAERSKGKKADDDKIKEYKESIRDLKDQIADMQGTLAEFFTDTDVTSAAKDFAQAWLDAYLSFENTTDVMKEKFNELIKSMIINSIMANLVQTILQPLFDEIEKRAKDGKLDERDITEIMAQIPTYVDAVDKSLQGGMEALKAAGFDINSLRDTTNALTGISRDIAGASEESINGVAAGINTANYYISYVPQIAQNVAAMRAIMEGNYTPVQSGPGVADIMALQNQSLTHLQAIDRHTAETVTECQKIAERCTAMAEDIHRVVVPKGTKGSYAVQTQIS
ncbi:MAG: tape measure protein [Alistipes sp.]|nr:tape measure protein [Lachnospiraceae bacterium]MCM1250266.1 tape measure protein [Alistipes sp.]